MFALLKELEHSSNWELLSLFPFQSVLKRGEVVLHQLTFTEMASQVF